MRNRLIKADGCHAIVFKLILIIAGTSVAIS